MPKAGNQKHITFLPNPLSSIQSNSIPMYKNQIFSTRIAEKSTNQFLTTTITTFIEDRLLDRDRRIHHKDQCSSRLASTSPSDVPYADQAVLANLDWGIDSLEEAISTSNPEARLARLHHADRMLQVCAMLDPAKSTANVPNSYLSAWAHLNLSFVAKLLLNSDVDIMLHILNMFDVDPFFGRIDFAPELWESLFLPHMGSIVGWYSEERRRIVMETMPDSCSVEFEDDLFDESLIATVRPDQAEKLRELEGVYKESLDCNTRMYAKYYKEVVGEDCEVIGRKGMVGLPPIVEAPATPVREESRKVPDFVKFGPMPILPKSAGFVSVCRDEEEAGVSTSDTTRSSVTTNSTTEPKESKKQIFMESLLEENEDKSDTDVSDVEVSEILTYNPVASKNMRTIVEKVSVKMTTSSRKKNHSTSLDGYSPVDSPKTLPKVPSPKPVATSKKESEKLLQLLSNRFTSPLFSTEDNRESTSEVSSPSMRKESEQLLRFLASHSAPLLASPQPRGTSLTDRDNELELRKSCRNRSSTLRSQTNTIIDDHVSPSSVHSESEDEGRRDCISLRLSEKLTPRTRLPKDFVCPITGQLFSDPVTLETGQTYERRAIEEWLKRGNTTCPITRQLLSSTSLPRTNYVLKRLITSWIEQNSDFAQEYSYAYTPSASLSPISSREHPLDSPTSVSFDALLPQTKINSVRSERKSKRFMKSPASNSPTRVISQAASEAIVNELKPYTSCLYTSDDLQECEAAVLAIARIWKNSKADPGIHVYLSKPTILNGFVEVLSASIEREVLRASIYVLSELVIADESVGETLTSVESDFDCLAALLVNGLAEAVVLMYQLRPTFSQLSRDNLVPSLVQVIMDKGENVEDLQFVIEPKDAAIAVLEQILSGGDENSRSLNATSVISANGLPDIVKCLNQTEGRVSVVSILLSCMRADKSCRNLIAKRAELLPVLELFHAGDDITRSMCIDFISELVCLNRRTFCSQVLQMIKDEGAFSSMHSFLVYLPMAPMEQQPRVASVLLQLDLLVEPRKMSIYREEAIDTIIEAVKRKEFPVCQIIALEILSSLSGRFSPSGEPTIEAWLLKIAGVDQLYNTMVKEGVRVEDYVMEEAMKEEEKAMNKWEKRVAFVLCNHDNGRIFKALEECLRSNSMEMAKLGLVISTWLTHMLSILPETGVKVIASQCLLGQFIKVLQSSSSLEEKVLAALALKTFISDPDALKELGIHAKRIYKSLRKLKRCSPVAADTLKAIINLPTVDATELWSCNELFEIDCTQNGEVLSLVHSEGRLFSSHSDGTIKVWDVGKRGLRLVQEAREHSKAVSCLYIPSSGGKLYSGSHDKTVRVWEIGAEEIHTVQVHDMKELVQCLTTNAELVCFASQGTGVKVCNGRGSLKHVNFNRIVKCLAMNEGNLYCGCTGYSIQEVDLSRCTSSTFYSGTRKLLGRQSIQALCVHDGILYAGGSSVDGSAGKAFSLLTKTAIGSFTTGIDIHCMASSSDFVFTGARCGVVEVWLRERMTRIGSLKVGSRVSRKVMTLASDFEGEMLFSGSSDGKIQVWTIN